MSINPNETLIVGSWKMVDGRMTEDAAIQRINALIRDELEKIVADGWQRLYRDPRDGRYWEMFFPHGSMHGGGPESLRALDLDTVQEKYGILLDQ